MKNSQKGFIVPLAIALVALVIGGGAYVYIKNEQVSQISGTETNKGKLIPTQVAKETLAGAQNIAVSTVSSVSYPTGFWPKGIAFDPVTKSVWVANNGSNTVSKININTGAKTDYAVDKYPGGIAFDPVTKSVWVTNNYSNTVSKVNIKTGTREDYPTGTPSVNRPTAIVLDSVTGSVWVVNDNILVGNPAILSKININTGARIDYPLGSFPKDIAFDFVTNSVWVINGEDTISKININTGAKIDYAVGKYPKGIAFDPVTKSVWVTNQGDNTISKININTGAKTDYAVDKYPGGIAFDPVTKSVWVTNYTSKTVSKMDINTSNRIDYPVGENPIAVVFDPITESMWVVNTAEQSNLKSKPSSVSKVSIYTATTTAITSEKKLDSVLDIRKVEPLDPTKIITDPQTGIEIVRDQILVIFKDGVSESDAKAKITSINGVIVGYISGMGDYQIRINGNPTINKLKELVDKLNNDPEVEAATLNSISSIQ